MQYEEHPVPAFLQEYVQTIWSLVSDGPEDTYPRSLIMPDGIVELVFHFADPFAIWQDNKRFIQASYSAVSMLRKFIEIESAGTTGLIAVRFFPWGAYHFFDKPVRDFLDQSVHGKELWGDDSEQIITQLKNADSIETRIVLVMSFLQEQLVRYQKSEKAFDSAMRRIYDLKGNASIEEVCLATHITRKQLERKFLQLVGTTPKTFSRVCRFLNVCRHMKEQEGKTLTQLSQDCGYYDQAHFINDFRKFSGFTPKEFFAKENIWFTEI